MLCGVLCGERCAVCGPHVLVGLSVSRLWASYCVLCGYNFGGDETEQGFGPHILCPLCVNDPNAFGGRNDPIDSLEEVMEMKEYAPTYPTSSTQCFSSDSCF
jgi:hypothetical protein